MGKQFQNMLTISMRLSSFKNLLIICAYVHDVNKCKPTTKNKDHVQTLICYFF